jgi:hypothetical protein
MSKNLFPPVLMEAAISFVVPMFFLVAGQPANYSPYQGQGVE